MHHTFVYRKLLDNNYDHAHFFSSTWYGSETSSCPSLQVNSVIISAVVVSSNQTVNTDMLSQPILITLQHEDTALQGPMCAFLDQQDLQQG